jgi:uncharacterized protein (TIGR00369 family)
MSTTPIMTAEAISAFLDETFPQLHFGGRAYFVDAVAPGSAVMRLKAGERHLRPGGTVSGPTLFALADLSAYCAVLAHIGPVALAVTTDLTIHFLRKPQPGDLLCEARLLKLGKSLAVIDCAIRGDGTDDLVAHAVATYSIPPRKEPVL